MTSVQSAALLTLLWRGQCLTVGSGGYLSGTTIGAELSPRGLQKSMLPGIVEEIGEKVNTRLGFNSATQGGLLGENGPGRKTGRLILTAAESVGPWPQL